jgi:macrolide transport system ATP-binding/permease protein
VILRDFRARLAHLAGSFDRARHDRELAQELDVHIQMHIEDNLRAGMTPAAARRDALIKLGGRQQTLERCRDISSAQWLDRLVEYRWLALLVDAARAHHGDSD